MEGKETLCDCCPSPKVLTLGVDMARLPGDPISKTNRGSNVRDFISLSVVHALCNSKGMFCFKRFCQVVISVHIYVLGSATRERILEKCRLSPC